MAYDFDWLDEDQRILAVRLYTPILTEEIEALRDQLTPVVETQEALYLLADIRNFDLMAAYSQLGGLLDTFTLPSIGDDQARQSRVAIIGGGPMINMVLKVAEGALPDGQEDLIRAFKHEDEAYRWLQNEAVGLV